DVGAGAVIGEMDVADRVRTREDKQIVVATDLAVPGVEARAAVALLVELELLDHGAHGAVEHQDALARDPAQRLFGSTGDVVCHRLHAPTTQTLIRAPITQTWPPSTHPPPLPGVGAHRPPSPLL